MKKNFVKFSCDSCSKELLRETGINAFPYELGWQYIYDLKAQTLQDYAPAIKTNLKQINARDRHFCCKKCLLKWIELQFSPEKMKMKSNKEILNEAMTLFKTKQTTQVKT